MKKLISLFLLFIILLNIMLSMPLSTVALNSVRLSSDGLYYYRVSDGKYAEFFGSTLPVGAGTVLEIPQEIEGYIVRYIRDIDFSYSASPDNDYQNIDTPEKVIIPNTVTYIGNSAFAFEFNLYSEEDGFVPYLKSVVIPSGVSHIGDRAFHGCYNLESIEIPSSVLYIGDNAFSNCKGLKTVKIPGTLQEMGSKVFANCKQLKKVIINEGITNIPEQAFVNCKSLKEVSFPKSLEIISDRAFENCISLRKIELSENLTRLYDGCFYNCPEIRTITLCEDVYISGEKTIGYFYNKKNKKEEKNSNLTIYCLETNGLLNQGSDVVNYARQNNLKFFYVVDINNKHKIKDNAGQNLSIKISENKVKSWTSSKPEVAIITNSGKLTTLTKGVTTITARLEDGSIYTKKLKVVNNPIIRMKKKNDDFYTTVSAISLKQGETKQLVTTYKADNIKNIYRDTQYAKIIGKAGSEKFKVKGIKKGVTNLKITVNGKKLNLKVNVK